MVNELEHIPDDGFALRWAIGCLFTSLIERTKHMFVKSISIRRAVATSSLSVVGLLLVYAAVVAAEAITVTPLALFLANGAGIPRVLLRIAILSLTALPIAYLTGYALRKWVPALSGRIIPAVAVLWILIIALLQIYVYAPSVLGSSILKVLFVVIPLRLAAYRDQPERLA
jgi:hypothetical protein